MTDKQEQNDEEVICPACCAQFRAIPVNVQRLMLDAGFEPPFVAAPPAQPARPLTLVQATAPREIWLQVSDEAEHSAEAFPADHEGITWCQDSVEACQVKYVRADLAAQPAEPGHVMAPHFRGYAHLGIGAYLLNNSPAGDPSELVISIASDADKAGRTVGDLKDNRPNTAIEPDQIAVRLRFENVAGLDALEQQLRFLREAHFPEAAQPAPAQEPVIGKIIRVLYEASQGDFEATGTEAMAVYRAIEAAIVPQWLPIESAPSDVVVLLYTPHLHETNTERVEARVYHDSRAGSRHAGATHWMPLPAAPKASHDPR